MEHIARYAPAKINLTLDVLGLRADGFHDIESVMLQIDLCDIVRVTRSEAGILVNTNHPGLPGGPDNLAWRAAALVCSKYGISSGVVIDIDKRIPLAAGLAGGSTDAAAVLHCMNRLFKLRLDERELHRMALELGSDVPFCLDGPAAIATGRGEILEPVRPGAQLPLLLVNPGFPVSTGQVYRLLDENPPQAHPDTRAVAAALAAGEVHGIASQLGNVMEPVTMGMHPALSRIKARLQSLGALGVLMSGSGPTLFSVFPDRAAAERAAQSIKSDYPTVAVSDSRQGDEDLWIDV